MKTIAALDHPHILPLFDYGESRVNDETLTYMVMPYRPEGSLTSWLQRRGSAEPLSHPDAHTLVDQAASAHQPAHTPHVIHQDDKSPSIIIQHSTTNIVHPSSTQSRLIAA